MWVCITLNKTVKMKIYLLIFSIIVRITMFAQSQFAWAKQVGGASDDQCNSIACDGNGNIYSTGSFRDTTDFDPGVGVYKLSSAGYHDVFVTKLDAFGNFIWAKKFGSLDWDLGYSIVADAVGNVFATGRFSGTVDFDPGLGIYNLTAIGYHDAFVIKLDAFGNFIWAKHIGGPNKCESYSIALDSAGNIITAGCFAGVIDFDPGSSVFNLSSNNYDVFVSKLDAAGNFLWAKHMGGTNDDEGRSVAVDAIGNVYTTGYFGGISDFDPGVGTFNLTSIDWGDIFISKLNPSGNFIWAKRVGGKNHLYGDIGNSLTVDKYNNVYTVGAFEDTADFDPGISIHNLISVGGRDIFISKLDSSGNFIWAKSMGGVDSDGDAADDIAVDKQGNVYTTGYFSGMADFDPGNGVYNLNTSSRMNTFICKIDSNGNFIYAGKVECSNNNQGNTILIDDNDNVYTSGGFSGNSNFSTGSGIINFSALGNQDVFVCKQNGSLLSLGYNNSSNTNSFLIFPNPSRGKFTVRSNSIASDLRISIYGLLGNCVLDKITLNTNTQEVDLSTQSKGIYFMEIVSENERSVKKIVLE